MADTIDRATGEILDAPVFFARLRDLDGQIVRADELIDLLKDRLKTARLHREGLVAELRSAARGDRTLPFDEAEPSTTPAADPQKGRA